MTQRVRLTGTTVTEPRPARGAEARDLGDVQLRHPCQLFDADALHGVDVGLALCRSVATLDRHLAGVVPRQAAPLTEHPGEIAEERDPPKRVAEWIFLAHTGIVGRWHRTDSVDPTAP